jgi:hypothetical protein
MIVIENNYENRIPNLYTQDVIIGGNSNELFRTSGRV